MRRIAEIDWAEVPYPETITGQTQAIAGQIEDEHGPHTFLYVPDLSIDTGWSTHRVPDRKPERAERRDMGFRRS